MENLLLTDDSVAKSHIIHKITWFWKKLYDLGSSSKTNVLSSIIFNRIYDKVNLNAMKLLIK